MAGSQVIFAECMSNVLIDRPGRCTGHRLGFTDEFLLRCVCGGGVPSEIENMKLY